MDLRELGYGAEKVEMGEVRGQMTMTEHTKNLLIVAVIAAYALFVVADWYGYIKEPYVTLIQATLNLPGALVRGGFQLYKTYGQHHYS
jgi:hypothetical protein